MRFRAAAAAAAVAVAVAAATGVAFGATSSTPAQIITAAQVTAAKSTDWAGYVIDRSAVTEAGTGWVVPAVAPGSGHSATFVGVDAANSGRILEVGTEQDGPAGATSYSAFYELSEGLAGPETAIPMTVTPGDTMVGELSQQTADPNDWKISLTDATTGAKFVKVVEYLGFEASADYIEEAPTVNGAVSSLANFGTVLFDGASINDGNANLAASEEIDKVGLDNHNNIVAATTGPDADINGFQVDYCPAVAGNTVGLPAAETAKVVKAKNGPCKKTTKKR